MPEEILIDFPPEVRALANRLRHIIKAAIPEAEERAYPHWRAIGFRHPICGYFCGIFPQPDRVDLAFEFGVLLPDPLQILDGRGKQVRYVHIALEEDIQLGAIQDLLLEVVNLPGNRAVKLEMIKTGAKRAD